MKIITTTGLTCCSCGITFSMDDILRELRQKDGTTFYCPNGHAQHYSESEATRLVKKSDELTEAKEEIRNLKTEVARLRCELANRRAPKGIVERVKGWLP